MWDEEWLQRSSWVIVLANQHPLSASFSWTVVLYSWLCTLLWKSTRDWVTCEKCASWFGSWFWRHKCPRAWDQHQTRATARSSYWRRLRVSICEIKHEKRETEWEHIGGEREGGRGGEREYARKNESLDLLYAASTVQGLGCDLTIIY